MGKIFGIAIALLLGIGIMSGCSNYNNLVQQEETVNKSITQVQNVLARQANLLPNLAEVALGYAKNEKEVFTKVSEARAGLTEVQKMKPQDIANDPKLQEKVIQAQSKANAAFAQLNAVREAYPELKAQPLFANLMSEVAGSQNRITVERKNASVAIANYNVVVRRVPGKIWASIFGFGPKPQFEASEEEKQTPKLKMT